MKQEKGMLVTVLRDALGDCTNGGISSKHDTLTLIGEGIDGIFEQNEKRPTLILTRRTIGGQEYLSAVPATETPKGMIGPMMGGNYVHTSDSRLKGVASYPIPVHDRYETDAEYSMHFNN